MDIFSIVLLLLMVAAFYFGFVRNSQVLAFRKGIINQISDSATAEINAMATNPDVTAVGVRAAGDQLLARYRIMDDPSYNQMVLQFWKPLNVRTWYPDVPFLKEK